MKESGPDEPMTESEMWRAMREDGQRYREGRRGEWTRRLRHLLSANVLAGVTEFTPHHLRVWRYVGEPGSGKVVRVDVWPSTARFRQEGRGGQRRYREWHGWESLMVVLGIPTKQWQDIVQCADSRATPSDSPVTPESRRNE